jgi:type II secretory pathway pseudopilin PulG
LDVIGKPMKVQFAVRRALFSPASHNYRSGRNASRLGVRSHSELQSAFALVTTLILIALLSIVAAGFLSSVTLERSTARAFVSEEQAELAAKAAVNQSIAVLKNNLLQYPDSATTWERLTPPSGGIAPEGTMLYFTPHAAGAAFNPAGDTVKILPLISGASAQPVTTKSATIPAMTAANSYDLNHVRFTGDTAGWIGSPSTGRKELRAPWVELTDPSTGKVVSRYAYWVDDESFKMNINQMGQIPRGGTSPGTSPSEIPVQGLLQTVIGSNLNAVAADVMTLRSVFPGTKFLEVRGLNQTNSQPTLGDSTKFLGTIYSGALNLSRHGSKRLNLNAVVQTSTSATTMRTQLDQIISAINYHAPNFGQRLYRTDTANLNSIQVASPDPNTYLQKLAANIRDYIDSDSQPTIVNNDAGKTIWIGSAPTTGIEPAASPTPAPNPVLAVGKEASPVIDEYMLRMNPIAWVYDSVQKEVNFTIQIDHFVEFWNLSTKDIALADLGNSPFLLIRNQFGWETGKKKKKDEPIPPGRDFQIPLSQFVNADDPAKPLVFEAGKVTVLTTSRTKPLPAFAPGESTYKNLYVWNTTLASYNAKCVYSGATQNTSNGQGIGWGYGNKSVDSLSPDPTNPNESVIALGNSLGIIDSQIMGPLTTTISVHGKGNNLPPDPIWRGFALKGNLDTPAVVSQVGDPRSNNEQLNMQIRSPADPDQTNYYDTGADIGPGNSTLTQLNSNLDATVWPDPAAASQSASQAPALISNSQLYSIGQLGDVYDPARKLNAGSIYYSRGGGRTLKIGQPERYNSSQNATGLWDGYSKSASREWTSWRLTDIFTTSDNTQLPGVININGVRRDNGAALKAALYDYYFGAIPAADPQLANASLSAGSLATLVTQATARLNNTGTFANTGGPFAERGELSELPMFDTGTDLKAGVDTATVFDRGREELFRRLVELTTTRGNVFSAYAVGQAIQQSSTGTKTVGATWQTKVTFQIDPVWNTAFSPTFNPNDPASMNTRFHAPDDYRVTILQVSN